MSDVNVALGSDCTVLTAPLCLVRILLMHLCEFICYCCCFRKCYIVTSIDHSTLPQL